MSEGRLRRRRMVQAAAVGAALPLALFARSAQAAMGGRALLIANTGYQPSDEDIAPARKCVTDLDVQLRRFGFEVTTLFEPALQRMREEIEQLRRAVAADPTLPALFYFVGHGFQSNAENLLVPAGGNLEAKAEDLARQSLSLERDVFARLARPLGPAATVILVDACRTPDRPLTPPEGLNQTLPPQGCHVAFATGPGKRAFAPQDPNRYTLFAEMLVAELTQAAPTGSVFASLERVRSRVIRRVNSIDVIVRLFGPDAQSPELASNVIGDPVWVGGGTAKPVAAPVTADLTAANPELAAIAALASPEEAQRRLKAFVDKLPAGELADLGRLRLNDLERVLKAAREARLNLDLSALPSQTPKVLEDAQRALRGDKYAALRVAESLEPPASGVLIERTDHGRWMAFSAHLGNGIAAWRLSLHFRNVDRRDAEAARYAKLARASNYIPPRQLGSDR